MKRLVPGPARTGTTGFRPARAWPALSTAATMLLLGGIVGGVILMMLSLWTVALFFELFIVALVALSVRKNRHGRTVIERLTRRLGWMNARYAGTNVYRAGPVSRVPGGTTQLPGLSARSTLTEHTDGYGRRFALIEVPQRSHFTVVLGSEPDGGGMVDQDQVNRWVDRWSDWLGMLTEEPGLVAASVTIETAPDSGWRLARRMQQRLSPDAPDFAKAIISETVDMLPRGATVTRAYIAVTFRAAVRAGGTVRRAAEMAGDLASRLPNLTHALAGTGAGPASPLTAQELCEVIRVAYDPAEAILFDRAHADGRAPDINWNEAGPRLFYANVEQFVTELIAHQYMRPVDSSGRNTRWTWCASWWRHREAVSRLNALWRAWEALRLDPTTGMTVWWRDYADPTMAVLFSETGPFHGCTPEIHQPKNGPLPLLPAPEGLFPSC